MKFTYALSLLSALSTSVNGADIWGNRVTAALAADSSDDEFDQICLKERQAVNKCFVDGGVFDEVETSRYQFHVCLDYNLEAGPLPSDPSDLCLNTCDVVNYCIRQSTGSIIVHPPCNDVLSTEANCGATYLVNGVEGKEMTDSCQCDDDDDEDDEDDEDHPCDEAHEAVNECFIDAEVSDDEVETARNDFQLCIKYELRAPPAGLLPSDLCPYTCDAFNDCIDMTTGNITASPPCNDVLSTEANCEATYLVNGVEEKEMTDSCDCSTPAAPPTSLGLVASVLKKNLRA